jgi:ribosomal protein S18 acetylase RimI-like enzyme
VRIRPAQAPDADSVARLHADSWRRHYRGAFADSYLDGDLDSDRRAAWSGRLARNEGAATVLAELDGRLLGFVHVVFDDDPTWGSLVDNLHVVHDQHRGGIGRRLMAHAAKAVVDGAANPTMHLFVLEQNVAAQQFYQAIGGVCVERRPTAPPQGVPGNLSGTPSSLRMAWLDASTLALSVH